MLASLDYHAMPWGFYKGRSLQRFIRHLGVLNQLSSYPSSGHGTEGLWPESVRTVKCRFRLLSSRFLMC